MSKHSNAVMAKDLWGEIPEIALDVLDDLTKKSPRKPCGS